MLSDAVKEAMAEKAGIVKSVLLDDGTIGDQLRELADGEMDPEVRGFARDDVYEALGFLKALALLEDEDLVEMLLDQGLL